MSEEKRLSQESGKEDTLKQNEKEMYIREIHTALEKADGSYESEKTYEYTVNEVIPEGATAENNYTVNQNQRVGPIGSALFHFVYHFFEQFPLILVKLRQHGYKAPPEIILFPS